MLSLPTFRLVRSWSLSLGAWVPRNLARTNDGFGGALLRDLLGWAVQRLLAARWCGRRRRRFILVIFRFGATLELGRSERTTMRPLWSYRVDAADTPDRKPR